MSITYESWRRAYKANRTEAAVVEYKLWPHNGAHTISRELTEALLTDNMGCCQVKRTERSRGCRRYYLQSGMMISATIIADQDW